MVISLSEKQFQVRFTRYLLIGLSASGIRRLLTVTEGLSQLRPTAVKALGLPTMASHVHDGTSGEQNVDDRVDSSIMAKKCYCERMTKLGWGSARRSWPNGSKTGSE
jgi:hypothetical protein